MTPRVLVAGIGNIFLGDDGFGPEVLRRLPPIADNEVRCQDYGIRGMHLAYDLLAAPETLVLVDALPGRGDPGRVQVMRADTDAAGRADLDAHGMDPAAVFAGVRALGGVLPPTIVVGCQVLSVAEGMGLSEPVAAALPEAVDTVYEVVERLRQRTEA